MSVKINAISPCTKLELLIALQNLSFLIVANRLKSPRERYRLRRLFLELAEMREVPAAPEPEATPVTTIEVSEQILVAVRPAFA